MPYKNYVSLALALVAIIIVYLLRLDTVKLRFDVDDRVKITGTLKDQPRIFEGKQQLVLSDVRIYVDRFPEYAYGDKVEVVGTVAKGEFGYYLKEPEVKGIREIGGIRELRGLEKFRKRLLEIFGFSLPAPFSGLAEGIVLGTKNSLDSRFYEALKTTGTLHVVVASGTNISLLGGLILYLLSPIAGRRIALLSSLLLIWVYVAVIGFDAPIVRAGIMGSLVYSAGILGREQNALRMLGIVGVIMLLINPLWLFDLGFQLSFAATAGILLFSSKLGRIGGLGKVRGINILPKVFKESLITTLAAQVFITPILFFSFGTISWISPLVNMLVLWTVVDLSVFVVVCANSTTIC